MLDPVIRESGTFIRGKTRISKAGDRIYRGALFMPVMVAVMRKILIIAHSLYKSGEKYSNEN